MLRVCYFPGVVLYFISWSMYHIFTIFQMRKTEAIKTPLAWSSSDRHIENGGREASFKDQPLYLPLAPVFSHLLKGLSNLGFWNNQYSPSSESVFSFYFTISIGTQTCPSISHLTKKKSSWPLNISWFFSSFWNSWRNNFELLFLPFYFPSFFRYLFRLWPYSKYTTVIMLTKPIVISLSSCFLSQQQLA